MHIPSRAGKNYILGDTRGNVFLFKTFQSSNLAVEILSSKKVADSIKKIGSARVPIKGRSADLVISLT